MVQILGLGLPAAMVFQTTVFFLEGIRRPMPGMIAMIIANIVNAGLNWLLIYGHAGLPPLGAEGSAWATTIVRTGLALGLVAYVWTMSGHERFAVRVRPAGGWRAWRHQREIGYAAGAATAVEAVAFAALNVFAGWLGPLPLAAHAIGINLLAMVFMVALGLGSATAVRVGIAHGRGDRRDLLLAGWTGLGVNTVAMGLAALAFALGPGLLAGLYTEDAALQALTVPVIAFSAWVLAADGGQTVMASALRGRGDTWVPTMTQVVAYFGVMIPLAWALSIPLGRGVVGLYEAVLVASIVAVALLMIRFQWLARRDRAGARVSVISEGE